ncbi:MAG: flagellar protein FliS [Eubacterium sp.]|nr:flagellar protein FliS [Eubacterium sp.]
MKTQLKQQFARRITQANKTQLIELVYDICFAYMEEAKDAKEADRHDAFKDAVRGAAQAVQQLKAALNFEHAISAELYRLYQYAQESLSRSMYRYDLSGINEATVALSPLKEAFAQLAGEDTSAAMMRNTQQVYAGMTYGKNDISENLVGDMNRGFLV